MRPSAIGFHTQYVGVVGDFFALSLALKYFV